MAKKLIISCTFFSKGRSSAQNKIHFAGRTQGKNEIACKIGPLKNLYTRQSYMTIRGKNPFVWANKDLMITLDEDIILHDVGR